MPSLSHDTTGRSSKTSRSQEPTVNQPRNQRLQGEEDE